MRSTRGGRLFCYLILALLLSPSIAEGGVRHKSCDLSKLEEQCGKNERCVLLSSQTKLGDCQCKRGYDWDWNSNCVELDSPKIDNATVAPNIFDTSSGGGGSSVAAGLLIPTFLVASAVLLYFGARRYKWLQRFRQYRQNRYGNVLVTRDDDDDDVPPIP